MRPSCRKHGVGRALLAAVAARTRERGGQRLEWSALDWNDLALDFYRGLGASQMDEWITHRLVGDELERLAAQAPLGAPIAFTAVCAPRHALRAARRRRALVVQWIRRPPPKR